MEIACPHCGQRNRVPAERLAQGPVCGKCREALLSAPVNAGPELLAALIAQDSLPVLVDFWAPWCGPCVGFAPTFKAAAAKYGGRVVFAKLDTEAHQAVGAQHNIRSIPTLASFRKGRELGRISGALPPAQLEQLVRQLTPG